MLRVGMLGTLTSKFGFQKQVLESLAVTGATASWRGVPKTVDCCCAALLVACAGSRARAHSGGRAR